MTDNNPLDESSACEVPVGKNNLYCDLLLITKELILCVVISLILVCICLDTVPNSVSSILSVAAIVLNPSGAKNITSPPNSCILLPSVHPMFLVIGVIAKSEDELPVNLNILSLPKIIKLSRKVRSPTISVSTLIVPPPLPLIENH